MAHQVFVSYSKENGEAAQGVCRLLEEAGIVCWVAPRDIGPGEAWAGAIAAAIKASKVMVVVVSRAANASPHVAREVELADGAGVKVVPVRVEEVKPEGALAYFLGNRQWVDAFEGGVERHEDALVRGVKEKLGEAAPPAPPPRRTAFPWRWVALVAVMAAFGVWAWRNKPAAPRIVSFTVEPEQVTAGEPVLIRWQVEGSEEVRLEPMGRRVEARGETRDRPATGRTYVLRARNRRGTVEERREVLVAAAGQAAAPLLLEEFVVTPARVEAGGVVTVRWRVRNAELVRVAPLEEGPFVPAGEFEHQPAQSMQYELVARGAEGERVMARRRVEVRPAAGVRPETPAAATGRVGSLRINPNILVHRESPKLRPRE